MTVQTSITQSTLLCVWMCEGLIWITLSRIRMRCPIQWDVLQNGATKSIWSTILLKGCRSFGLNLPHYQIFVNCDDGWMVCLSKLRPINSIIQQIAHIVVNLLCRFCLMGTSWMPKKWLEKEDPLNKDYECLQYWPLHALGVFSCPKSSSCMHSSLNYTYNHNYRDSAD